MLSLRFILILWIFQSLLGQIFGATFYCKNIKEVEFDRKSCLLSDLTDDSDDTDISFSSSGSVDSDDFQEVHIIASPNLNTIPPEIFKHFARLEALKIREAHIRKLNGNSFKFAEKLKKLEIAENRLQELVDDDVKYLENLEELSLEGNPINYIDPKIFEHLKKLKVLDLRRAKCVDEKFQLLTDQDFLNMKEKLRECFSNVNPNKSLKEMFDARQIIDPTSTEIPTGELKSLLSLFPPSIIEEIKARKIQCLTEKRKMIEQGEFTDIEARKQLKECFTLRDLFLPLKKPAEDLLEAHKIVASIKDRKSEIVPAFISDIVARRQKCIQEKISLIADGNFAEMKEKMAECWNMTDLVPPRPAKTLKTMFDVRQQIESPKPPMPPIVVKIKERILRCLEEKLKIESAGSVDIASESEALRNCFNISDLFPISQETSNVLMTSPSPAVPTPLPPPFIIDMKKRIAECVEELQTMIAAGDFVNITARMNDCFNLTDIFSVPDDDPTTKTLEQQFDARNVLKSVKEYDNPKQLTLQEAFKKPVMAVLGASKSKSTPVPKFDAFDFLIRNYFNALNNVTNLIVDGQSSVFWLALLLIVFMVAIEIYILCIKKPDNKLYMQIPGNQDF